MKRSLTILSLFQIPIFIFGGTLHLKKIIEDNLNFTSTTIGLGIMAVSLLILAICIVWNGFSQSQGGTKK